NAANFSNLIAPIPGELNPIVNAFDELAKILPKVTLPPAALNTIEQFVADVHALGLATGTQLTKAADAALARYQRLAQGGIASAEQIEEAYLQMLQALQAEFIATHGIFDEELAAEIKATKEALDKIRGTTADHLKKTRDLWQQWGRQIQSIISNF